MSVGRLSGLNLHRMSITATGGAEAAPPADSAHGHAQGPLYKLAIGAIGIVFGDIGTSPIYSFRETFAGHHPLSPDQFHIYAVLSMIFWSMMIVVTLKYVMIIMRADNKGEGGSLALLALINRTIGGKKKWANGIVMLGVFATALFYGDSMITPAISVLSAVEGLTTVNTGLAPFVIPIAIGILVGLFAIQARGTAKVGLMFGPVMLFYFATIAVLGRDPHHGPAERRPGDDQPAERGRLLRRATAPRIPGDGFGRPGADGSRGLVRGHGPFRAPADQGRLALLRPPRLAAQLHGAGRHAPVLAGRPGDDGGQGPVLLPCVRRDAAAAGPDGDRGDDHRQPGGDQRRLLGHPAGDPARLRAAPSHHPHQRERGRANLHPDGQLGADGDGPDPGADVPHLVEPRRRLRHRRHRRDAHRYRADCGRLHDDVEMEPDPRRRLAGALLPGRSWLLQLQPDEDPRGRLVPAAGRRDRLHLPHDLGEGPPVDDQPDERSEPADGDFHQVGGAERGAGPGDRGVHDQLGERRAPCACCTTSSTTRYSTSA